MRPDATRVMAVLLATAGSVGALSCIILMMWLATIVAI
jgi:hypothetical protein